MAPTAIAAKLVPVGYGIKKLQIMCVVEDEKVSVDDLSEQICEFEDYVSSPAMSLLYIDNLHDLQRSSDIINKPTHK